jgi:aryl-alcohol dehydrogenase-like predicted oxidoreductase
MKHRILGRTGLSVSQIALGAGPISGLMTGNDIEQQFKTLRRAQQLGVNWIDTAAGYGQGRSEASIGQAFAKLDDQGESLQIATKVRLMPDQLSDFSATIRASVAASLDRLGRTTTTLLQLHNGVTPLRGDQATSLTVDDVLRPGGVLSVFRQLQREGICQHIGLTGTGDAESLLELIGTAEFDTIQIPFNLANPTAGYRPPLRFSEYDYRQLIDAAQQQQMGVFAIRVFAAGALLGNQPTDYTRNSPYFPLSLYERDVQAAARIRQQLGDAMSLKEAAIRFPLTHPALTAAIVGVKTPSEIEEVAELSHRGALSQAMVERILDAL